MILDYLSVWPVFVCLALAYAAMATPLFHRIDAPPTAASTRNPSLDGLRGFLAIAVVVHHGATYHGYLLTHEWVVPPSNVYTGLGQGGVAMFFMITGFLFWGKILAARYGQEVDWRALYIGRLFRIGPVYLLAVLLMLLVVGAGTGWTFMQSRSVVAIEIANWLLLGMGLRYDVNGFDHTGLLLAGVTWSLNVEWKFYFSLLFLSLLMSAARRLLPTTYTSCAWIIPCVALVACLLVSPRPNVPDDAMCGALFSMGMLVAARKPTLVGPDWVWSSVVLVCIAVALAGFPSSYQTAPILLLGVAFALIASGCTVFGIITGRPAIRLGEISYGIYLLQGLALSLAFRPAPFHRLALASPAYHWLLFLGAVGLLIVTASIVHIVIERPGIALGRQVARRSVDPPRDV